MEGTIPKLSTRDKIIFAAIKMFSKRGFSGTSTSEIAKEAGCAEGTIFRYFPKKIDLLKYVSQEFIKQFAGGIATKSLHDILKRSDEMNAEELIEVIMHDRIKLVQNNLEILKIVIYEINFHSEVKELFMSEFKANLHGIGVQLAEVLEEKLNAGQIDVYLILRTMLGQISGIIIQVNLFESIGESERKALIDRMVKESSQVVINGLRGVKA